MSKWIVEVVCVAEVEVEASTSAAAHNKVLKSVFDDDSVEWSTSVHVNPYDAVYGTEEVKEKKRARKSA